MNPAHENETSPGSHDPSRRKFLPQRNSRHPLWQWALAVVFRLAIVPVAMFALVTGVGFCQDVMKTGSYGEFSLMGFNRTNRAIAHFYVEGHWGGNMAAHGEGGTTCCTSLGRASKVLHIRWILDWKNMDDADRNLPMETYEAEVPLPFIPKGAQSGYLHIHFYPGNRVGAAYTAHLDDPEIKPQATGRRVADTHYDD